MLSGRIRGSICIWARLSIWKTPVVSARFDHSEDRPVIEVDPAQVHGFTPDPVDLVDRPLDRRGMPSPSRSILRKPASPAESLSHWTIWRCSIAAGATGRISTSGRVAITIPTPNAVKRDGAGCGPGGKAGRDASSRRVGPFAANRTGSGHAENRRNRWRKSTARAARFISRVGDRTAGVGSPARNRWEKAAKGGGPGRTFDGCGDQPLPDVPGEVEINVRGRGHLFVEKRPGKRSALTGSMWERPVR